MGMTFQEEPLATFPHTKSESTETLKGGRQRHSCRSRFGRAGSKLDEGVGAA